jgi:hypothetical protein
MTNEFFEVGDVVTYKKRRYIVAKTTTSYLLLWSPDVLWSPDAKALTIPKREKGVVVETSHKLRETTKETFLFQKDKEFKAIRTWEGSPEFFRHIFAGYAPAIILKGLLHSNIKVSDYLETFKLKHDAGK